MSQRGWFLIYAALIIWASTSMCLIKPKLWLVGLTFGAMCLMYAWMWLLGKVGLKVDMAFARQRGLTSEQYQAGKPAFRFDRGGWPFQRQVEGHRREQNGWIVIGGLSRAYALGKGLSMLAN
jgi:hypothetical protein